MPRIDPAQPSPSGDPPPIPPSPRPGSPSRLAPPTGLQGRASSSGSSLPPREPTPARFAALERADKAAATTGNQVIAAPPPDSPLQQYRRDDRLARVRLDLARELDALTMQDTVPTGHAQHLHADMLHGASLLMAHTTGTPSDRPLEALLQAGLRHNRAAAANQSPDLLQPLVMGTAESAAFARLPERTYGFVISGTTDLGSHRLRQVHQMMVKAGSLAPQASTDARTTVAHEFVHEMQHNRLEPLHDDPEAFSTDRQATLVSRQAGRLMRPKSTARPMNTQAGLALSSETGHAPDPSHPHGYSLYRSQPQEVHAHLEQAAVLRTMAAPGVHQRPATPEVTGLAAALADQLRPVAQQLAADGNSTPDDTVMRFDRHADKFASVANVMARLANLHGYSHSPAFGDAGRRRVQDATAQLRSLEGSNQPGSALEQACHILDNLLEALEDDHGLALEAHGPADAAAFEQGKSQPLAHAARVLDLEPSQLRNGLDGVFKQGRLQRHLNILDFVRKATPERKAELLQAAVNEQACAWLGLETTPWQERKLPPVKVNVYDAPPGPIPSAPGLNAGPGPNRKIEFDPLTWQLHVPAQALDQQPQELGGPLAKAGLDVAKAAALLAHGQFDTPGVRVQDVDPGHISRHVQASIMVLGPPPGGEQTFPGMHPLLKQALVAGMANPQLDRPGTPWHTGVRPSVKDTAYDGDPGAQTAYMANAAARWEDPLVALRRAVGAAGAAVTPRG